METIKSIIVDDEINGRENLRGVLKKYCPEVDVVAEADCAIAAVDSIKEHSPDLVFLDIEMPGGNGFKVLEFFKRPDFQIIFVTAYDQYAIQAIRFSALDYILKPIDAIKLKEAVDRFLNYKEEEDFRLDQFMQNKELKAENKKIALPFSDKIDYVEVKNIIQCKGEANYTRVYLSCGREHLVSKPLIDFEEILQGYGFIRTHKTHMVNLTQVSAFIKSDGGYLKMTDDSSVPVSRRKKDYVLDELKKL
ncbi:LytR/AlgR family response regulator transcription factor [Labilibacter marinus]|uniref:LytR/AlgR family response regulator transcription factor n=1 Tax=Labilibacter marinus TaxID=1477105 RepID=UPI00094FA1A4|nr:LytTR family DNA-binding domain-containing protein [Labilibacter marinus]